MGQQVEDKQQLITIIRLFPFARSAQSRNEVANLMRLVYWRIYDPPSESYCCEAKWCQVSLMLLRGLEASEYPPALPYCLKLKPIIQKKQMQCILRNQYPQSRRVVTSKLLYSNEQKVAVSKKDAAPASHRCNFGSTTRTKLGLHPSGPRCA
jgi:hypothetical protein